MAFFYVKQFWLNDHSFNEVLSSSQSLKKCRTTLFSLLYFEMENTRIHIYHYRFLYDAIHTASPYHGSKWEDIALRLISFSKMNEISERNLTTDIRKKYYETFEAWCHSKGEYATLGKIIEVLESEKLPNAAQSIREKYGIVKSPSRPSNRNSAFVTQQSFSTSKLLRAKSVN